MIEPKRCIDRVYEATGECLPLGTTVYTADHAVGVDIGDLCAELDQRIGEPIERAVGRYLDRQITRHIRENIVRELAEKIITYDRVVKESNG